MKVHIMHPSHPDVPKDSKKQQEALYNKAVMQRHEENSGPGGKHYDADKANGESIQFDKDGNFEHE